MTRQTGWPSDIARRLKELVERCTEHRYRGWKRGVEAASAVYGSLDHLRALDMDAEAAAATLAAIEYVADEDVDDYWRKVWHRLHIDRPEDVALFELRKEGHVEALLRANVAEGRSDPATWNQVRSPEELWRLIERARFGSIPNLEAELLGDLNRRRTWVLLWDQNLSGTHMSDWTLRLAALQASMPGTGERRLVQASAVATDGAIYKMREKCPHVELIVGGTLKKGYTQQTVTYPDRLRALCKQFHEVVFKPIERDYPRRHRDVGAHGYKDGGLLLVRQTNCPNNSLPFLWYHDSDRYQPPFPRISPYGHEHTSSTPPALRDLVGAAPNLMSAYQASNALAMGLEPLGCVATAGNGRPYDTWERSLSHFMREVCEDGDRVMDHGGLLRRATTLERWLPTGADDRVKRLRHGVLVAVGFAALRSGDVERARRLLDELDRSPYKPSARDEEEIDAAIVQFERKFTDAVARARSGGAVSAMPTRGKIRISSDGYPVDATLPRNLKRWQKVWPPLVEAMRETPGKPVPSQNIADSAGWGTAPLESQRTLICDALKSICDDLKVDRNAIPNFPGQGYGLSHEHFEFELSQNIQRSPQYLAPPAPQELCHPHRKLVQELVELARGGGNNHLCIPATPGLLLERVFTLLRQTLKGEGGRLIDINAEVSSSTSSLLAEISGELLEAHVLLDPPRQPVTATWIRNRLVGKQPRVLLLIHNVDFTLYSLAGPAARGEFVRELCSLGIPVVFTSLRPVKRWCIVEGTASSLELHDIDPAQLADDWEGFTRGHLADDTLRARYLADCGGSPRLFEALVQGRNVEALRMSFAHDIWTRLRGFEHALLKAARGRIDEIDAVATYVLRWGRILDQQGNGLCLADPALGEWWALWDPSGAAGPGGDATA